MTVNKDGEIPVMRGNDKDHKPGKLRMRPLHPGMTGPTKELSEIVSEC